MRLLHHFSFIPLYSEVKKEKKKQIAAELTPSEATHGYIFASLHNILRQPKQYKENWISSDWALMQKALLFIKAIYCPVYVTL